MSLAAAVPLGIGAGLVFGAATAGQHAAAHGGAAPAGIRGLPQLVRQPLWLVAFGGQALGFGLQALALGAGPVVLVQPLLVLALPASLWFSWALGGPRPTLAQYVASFGIIVALAVFTAMVSDGETAVVPSWWATMAMAGGALLAGVAVNLAVSGSPGHIRAVVYGLVSGTWSGLVGVVLNICTQVQLDHGIAGFARADGLVALLALLVLGACTLGLAQLSYQAAALAASVPVIIAAPPVVAVIFGAALLDEYVPISAGYAIGYAACLTLVVLGSIRLAAPPAPSESRSMGQRSSELGPKRKRPRTPTTPAGRWGGWPCRGVWTAPSLSSN